VSSLGNLVFNLTVQAKVTSFYILQSASMHRFILPLFICIALALGCSSCLIGRFAWYNFSGITDYKIFPSRPLPASPTPFHFHQASGASRLGNARTLIDSLTTHTPTVALLIIRHDTLLYEGYFRNYQASSTVASFSVAKSFTSALIGIAISEGKIKSVEDKLVDYVPELKYTPGFERITLLHLLQMTSGIKSSEGYYSPFSMAAKTYYGRNLRTIIAHLKIAYAPGTRFSYQSINTQLLGLVLERATKQHITDYLKEKIWIPMGAEFEGSWSIDKKKNGLEKTFCCLNLKARDYAKFGRLYLHKGNWNGQQLVPASWVETSTRIDTTQGSAWYYQYQWWITHPKEANFTANGLHGQFIYVNPRRNLVIVRLGKSTGKGMNWHRTFERLASYF
jgi:CubicO group peptidase (beta-lactamase class C family)